MTQDYASTLMIKKALERYKHSEDIPREVRDMITKQTMVDMDFELDCQYREAALESRLRYFKTLN